jgi:hypothetical protein
MNLQELRELLIENQTIAIYVGGGFLFLILLIYLFLRVIFSKDAAEEIENTYRKDLNLSKQANLNIPNIISDEDLSNYVERLKLFSVEGTAIAQKLEKQVAEKGKELNDMEIYMEQLRTQEDVLKLTLQEANIEPVPLLNTVRLAELQRKAKNKASLMLWTGLFLGILLGVACLASYVHFILKVSILKIWW